jgi:adenylyl-sulfate kinase
MRVQQVATAGNSLSLPYLGCVVWLTGLSGAGKTTIARTVEARLNGMGAPVFVLDGDELRSGLCRDLGYSAADRHENVRRAAEAAKLVAGKGQICVVALISPFRVSREMAGGIVGRDRFIEVHVATEVTVCEQRDVKGLYARARKGEIPEFTGVSSPYEPPVAPHLRIDAGVVSAAEAAESICNILVSEGWIDA